MGRYSAPISKATTATGVGVASVEAPGASMRRAKIYEFLLGSGGAPGDGSFVFQAKRSSTANTGTSVTPRPLDPADAAAVTLVKEELTAEGTSLEEIFELPLNQRATMRWVAQPGSEIVIPATANAGLILRTPTLSGTPRADCSVFFEE